MEIVVAGTSALKLFSDAKFVVAGTSVLKLFSDGKFVVAGTSALYKALWTQTRCPCKCQERTCSSMQP